MRNISDGRISNNYGGYIDSHYFDIQHHRQHGFACLGIYEHGARNHPALDDRFRRVVAVCLLAALEMVFSAWVISIHSVCGYRVVVEFSNWLDVCQRDLCPARMGHDGTANQVTLFNSAGRCQRDRAPSCSARQSAGVGRIDCCIHIYPVVAAMDFGVGNFFIGREFTRADANHCMV